MLHVSHGRGVPAYAPVCASSSSSPRSGTAPAFPVLTRMSATANAATAPSPRAPTATSAAAPGPMTPTVSVAVQPAATASASTMRAAAAAMPPSRSAGAASPASVPCKCRAPDAGRRGSGKLGAGGPCQLWGQGRSAAPPQFHLFI